MSEPRDADDFSTARIEDEGEEEVADPEEVEAETDADEDLGDTTEEDALAQLEEGE